VPTTYLDDVVAKVRIDLHDEDATAYRWTAATLQRHIAHALADYSLACPLTNTLTIEATDTVRDYALSATAVTGRPHAPFAVECPYDADDPEYPANLVPWRIIDDVLMLLMDDAPAAGDVIRVWYHTGHTLTNSTRTYPPEDENIIITGAEAYAALDREAYATERITVDADTTKDYYFWGTRKQNEFQKLLAIRSRQTGQSTRTVGTWDTTDI
jgi:hypothetical protein